MTLKLKSTTNELWKGWKLACCHHFTHIACAKKLRGLWQKLDPLRVKMDNLFRSIRVSDENSSVTKAFHFFELISTPDFLCVQYAPFEDTSSILDPFWLHLLFPCIYWFFELNDPEIEKHNKWQSEKIESWLGIIISPT